MDSIQEEKLNQDIQRLMDAGVDRDSIRKYILEQSLRKTTGDSSRAAYQKEFGRKSNFGDIGIADDIMMRLKFGVLPKLKRLLNKD